jgi:hypothetical protein
MSVLSLTVGAGAAALLLGVSACSAPPWTLSQSPSTIALRWYSDATPAASADQVAELHCQSSGKSAELVTDAKDGSDEVARFRCR